MLATAKFVRDEGIAVQRNRAAPPQHERAHFEFDSTQMSASIWE